MARILLAGLAGGVIMFFWGFVSHMLLPTGQLGIHLLDQREDTVIASLRDNAPQSGVYLFPGMDMRTNPTEAEQEAWAAKYRTGPSGMIVIRREGAEPSMGRWLGVEFCSNLAAALVGALLLAKIGGNYATRVAAMGGLGLVAWLSINVSYWNWYGFPTEFVLGESVEQVVGWALSGLGMAAIVRAPAT